MEQIEPRTPISSLPFTITASGSYYLTTNLIGNAGQNGITIEANNVTIDLMGFQLQGPRDSSIGVAVPFGVSVTNVAVQNGTVSGWFNGVDMGNAIGALLHNLLATRNFRGLTVGSGGRVVDCTASRNNLLGIFASDSAVISGCTADGNGNTGISSFFDCTINNCSVRSNQFGISTAGNSTIIGCTVNGNTSLGIFFGSGCTIKDCTANSNGDDGFEASFNTGGSTISGCTARGNGGDGIEVYNSCHVTGNTCDFNGRTSAIGSGINVNGQANRIDGNHLASNGYGIKVLGSRNVIVRNTVGFNATNLNLIVFINDLGPTNAPAATATSPWANIIY